MKTRVNKYLNIICNCLIGTVILVILMITIIAVNATAIELQSGTVLNPSQSNTTYIINTTQTGITTVLVNETCLTIDATEYCYTNNGTVHLYVPEVVSLPSQPTIQNNISNNESIWFNWTKNADHTSGGFLVHRNGLLVSNISNITTLEFNSTGLQASTSYTFSVYAYNFSGVNYTITGGNTKVFSTTSSAVMPVTSFSRRVIGNLESNNASNEICFVFYEGGSKVCFNEVKFKNVFNIT